MELKRLLNKPEEATNAILKQVCEEWGAHVFIKVRLADVFPLDGSGIAQADYRFALQSHFDFIVTDTDLKPLFAVEFDSAYLTFRTLFRTSEAILEEPPAKRGEGTIYRLCHALQPIAATLLSS